MAVEIQNPVETAVGGVVLAAAIGFGVYASQAGGASSSASDGQYELVAVFSSVNGIEVGTDVRIAGINVGRVESISLDPTLYKARVVISVDDAIDVSSDAFLKVDSEGLLGGSFMDLEPGSVPDDLTGVEKLSDGGVITSTQGAVSLITLLAQFASGGDDK